MPTSLYNFQYVPLTGRLPGKSFVIQTEQAINGLAQYVYDNSTNYEAVKAIAQKAEQDSSSALSTSEEALDKAQTALETVGRAYIKTTSAVDLNDYYDSELLLILSTESTNLPANITGYLTVMSSDTHDYCMQVYIGIDGSVYKRTATISNNTPTFGAWSETPITLSSLQTILANYTTVDASNIGVNADTDNSIVWGNAIGGGEIVSGEQRLVTGDTVYESEYQLEQKVETDIGVNDKRITNIEKLLQGNLYDYQTDSTTAYTKTVPSGAMPYAGIEKIAGKSVAWNQLIYDPTMTSASNWQIYIADTNFTMTASSNVLKVTQIAGDTHLLVGTKTNAPTLINGHKYYMAADIRSNASRTGNYVVGNTVSTGFSLGTSFARFSSVVSANVGLQRLGLYINASYIDINDWIEIKNFICVDLTLMFGAGNEPTIEEFEAMFPVEIYPFSTGTLLSAGVTEVVSNGTGKNIFNGKEFFGKIGGFLQEDNSWLVPISIQNIGGDNNPYGTTFADNKSMLLKKDTRYTLSFDIRLTPDSGTVTDESVLTVGFIYGNGMSSDTIQVVYTDISGSPTSWWKQWHHIYVTSGMSGYGGESPVKKIVMSAYMLNGRTIQIKNIQLEESSTETSYEPNNGDVYFVPTSVQALEGYGWGIDNVYNEVDIENKKYIKRINKYDFTGSEALAYYGSTFHETTETFTIIFYNTALFGKASNRKCISNNFTGYVGFNWDIPFAIFFNPAYNDSSFLYLIFPFSIKSGLSTSSTNAEKIAAAKEWLQAHPTTLYYQAETSTETDISAYLTDDNLIEVEAGGTLTFVNQHGDDYRLPVPSEETYMIDLQEALS